MKSSKPIIVALDFSDQNVCLNLVDKLDPSQCRLKVGKEMFTYFGPQFIQTLQQKGFDIFLDLKFHDIPNTVAKAVTAAADLGVWMVNVHASGGFEMMNAAATALKPFAKNRPKLIAVTVLTSMQEKDLKTIAIQNSIEQQVMVLAKLAQQSQLDGVVCSAKEAPYLRQNMVEDFLLVTPGIRPEGSSKDDQKRIVTPSKAISMGSSYLVIGRPITKAADPMVALEAIIASIQ